MKFCQTCLDFANLYAAKTEELLAATSNMAGVAGAGKREAFELARLEIQRLRGECDTARADMKRHQSEQHHAPDVSGEMSECVAEIIRIVRSEFGVNAVFDRSPGRRNISFIVSGKQYRVYLSDHFEEQYYAAPQTGELILRALPERLRASSTRTRSVLVSRSGITELPSS